jgi:AraC-like DNA-binding protein
MLSPGQTHYWELSNDIKGIILFHSKEFFDVSFTHHSIYNFPFFYSVHNSSALFLSHTQQEHFQTLFSQILKENESQKMLSRQKIVSLLNCLYIDLSRIYINTQNETILRPGKYAEHLRALEELIETHYKTLKSASDYANMLNITMRHLNRLTQQALNKSTTQLITERVILEAKRLIAYDSSSMTKIAYDLGYNDYTYFSRLFKKWTGQTPSEFSESYKPR